jgi:hypothetical protein
LLPHLLRQKNISDVLVWAGDERGENWRMYSVSYRHNQHVGCKTKALNLTVHGKPTVQTIGCATSSTLESS